MPLEVAEPPTVTGGDPATPPAEGFTVSPLGRTYHARLHDSFVNPFTGMLTAVDSSTGRALRRLGFRQSPTNHLHLEWSPDEYLVAFHRTYTALALRKKRDTTPTSLDVLRVLLRPFDSATSWRRQVAEFFRSGNTALIGSDLGKRYAALTEAYTPPKLDAMLDPDLADMALTPDQTHVLQLALRGYHLYIGGSAGTGKTVLLQMIYRRLTEMGLRVALTATTGVSAVQLGGCTFHHAFNVPMEGIVGPRRRWDTNALRAVDVVVVDEVSLLDAMLLDCFDVEARLARMHNTPFGGLQVILCGDFLQLAIGASDALPVYKSDAFHHFLQLQLVTPMRHRVGDPLLNLLTQLRRGIFDGAALEKLDHPLPPGTQQVTYIFPRRREAQILNESMLAELQSAEMTFTPQREPLTLLGTFTSSAHIRVPSGVVPRKEELLKIIQEEALAVCPTAGSLGDLNCVFMPARTADTAVIVRLRYPDAQFNMRSTVADTSNGPAALSAEQWTTVAERFASRLGGIFVAMYDVEPVQMVPLSVSMALADLTVSDIAGVMAPLRLKLGCRVMINRNLSRTVSNGSVGVVEAFAAPDLDLFPVRSGSKAYYRRVLAKGLLPKLPIVRLMTGEVVQVPPLTTVVGGTHSTYYYGHEVYTLPLQLGYGFTVHKVQGLTLLGTVIVDCQHFFECPHLIYVACSRVRQMDQLIVRNLNADMVTVKRSALQFCDTLKEAKDVSVLTVPSDMPRGHWVCRNRVFHELAVRK